MEFKLRTTKSLVTSSFFPGKVEKPKCLLNLDLKCCGCGSKFKMCAAHTDYLTRLTIRPSDLKIHQR